MQWFRFYTEALDDPKVQRLPDALFKTWVNLLCLARKHDGKLPADIADMAFALRLPQDEMQARFDALKEAGLIDDNGGDPEPHNWNGRQFKSDHDGNERVRRYREKKRNVTRNVTGNDGVTPPEQIQSRADTEQNREEEAHASARPLSNGSLPKQNRKQGTRLPEDWQPSEAEMAYAVERLGEDRAAREVEDFRDYWLPKTGKDATKLDWGRTWKRWVRRAPDFGPSARGSPKPGLSDEEERVLIERYLENGNH